MDEKLNRPYNPDENEAEIYSLWEKSGFFNPDICREKGATLPDEGTFSMVLPPPNVTGTLHMGHASMLAIEDIIARFNRMQGKETLWLPGTDHAAIATETKVEKMLVKQEDKSRHDLGREEFLKRVEKFAEESRATITSQMKKMGASVDWSREAFTLDKARAGAVKTAFKKLYDLGLLYRGSRIVNWDPKMQTTVSDDEVVWKEEKTLLYYLKYGPFSIVTARPETKFGDKYVVVHPDDKRYAEFADGQKIEVEWINGKITATVIKDSVIDMEFGSGAMTITPWHDVTDFEIAERHNLDKEQIIDLRGKLLPIAGEFSGTHIKKARGGIIEKLKAKGLVEKIDENYVHRIATSSRGDGVIEPQIMKQWFMAVNKSFRLEKSNISGIEDGAQTTLKEIMDKAVRSGQIEIIPEHFKKVYFHWIENLRDWCVSRQIWYGHPVPAWHGKNGEIAVGEKPDGAEADWTPDPDTLDTWFSSGLWTFSTLGWPEETANFKKFHPTDVLETGYDILFFWVARMILMSGALLGSIPFKKVYLHGIVRDETNRKMSKSLGNIIDPVDEIGKFGADAVRMALIIKTAPGSDNRYSPDKTKAYKHFANKIWNISRFVLMNCKDASADEKAAAYSEKDAELLKNLDSLIKEITKEMEDYKFYIVGEKIYHYVWREFADKIIQESKAIFSSGSDEEKKSRRRFLLSALEKILKILHPFMPFITEKIWQSFPSGRDSARKEFLMVERWPVLE